MDRQGGSVQVSAVRQRLSRLRPFASVRQHWTLGIVLLVGLAHGLIFVFLAPPWQHYDEPGHFEYAWMIANRPSLPVHGEYDQALRREVAASMVEHGFFKDLDYQPNLLAMDRPVWIGISQVGELPAYYWIVALPLRLARGTDITFQLYLGRLVSLVLYLITLAAAYALLAELQPPGSPLVWIVPLAMALLPGFTDLMTAVNSDVGATAFFSLFLWISVRMARNGFTWLRLVALAALAALCWWTKNTVGVALALAGLPLLFALLRAGRRRLAWGLLAAVVLAGTLAAFNWGDAALWSRQTYQGSPTRVSTSLAPTGSHAFQLVATPADPNPEVIQVLPRDAVQQLQGKTVTLGAWIWSDSPGKVQTPLLVQEGQPASSVVTVSSQPAFYTLEVAIGPQVNRMAVALTGSLEQGQAQRKTYYSGVVILAGQHSAASPPRFADPGANRVQWDGRTFSNPLRNSTAANTWPMVRPWLDKAVAHFFPGRASLILSALLDPASASWYYQTVVKNMLYTFWARFGWSQVPLLGDASYPFLGAVSAAGLVGAVVFLARRRKSLPWEIALILGAALAAVWGPAFMRGISSLVGPVFIPAARYAYPAIIPTVLLLVLGWREIFQWAESRANLPGRVKYWAFFLFFAGLDILAWVSVSRFYSGG